MTVRESPILGGFFGDNQPIFDRDFSRELMRYCPRYQPRIDERAHQEITLLSRDISRELGLIWVRISTANRSDFQPQTERVLIRIRSRFGPRFGHDLGSILGLVWVQFLAWIGWIFGRESVKNQGQEPRQLRRFEDLSANDFKPQIERETAMISSPKVAGFFLR